MLNAHDIDARSNQSCCKRADADRRSEYDGDSTIYNLNFVCFEESCDASPYISSLNLVDANVYRRRQTRRLIVSTMIAISIVATRRTG